MFAQNTGNEKHVNYFSLFFWKNIENQVALISCKTVQGQKRCVQKDKQNQGPIEFLKGVFSGPKADVQVW